MALHFDRAEYDHRIEATTRAMKAQRLDALLMFRQESMFYLTGYDTFGFCFFQCMVLTADGQLVLLTRAPDLRQAQLTSIVTDIRIWKDGAAAEPTEDLRAILEELDLDGGRLGIELDAYGFTGRTLRRFDRAMEGFAAFTDASGLVSDLRIIKSEAEIAYVRRAAELGDDALDAGLALIGPGADEGEILAAMQGAVFRGGGDYAGNEFIIGSGEHALLCRYFTGRQTLKVQDQLTLEFAGAYRHYHAAMMRTVPVGTVTSLQKDMHSACQDALLGCEAALTPGTTMGEVFQVHADIFDKAGYGAHRMNACGYSQGTTFAPIWMDYPMFYQDNPTVIQPGMVFFLHMILMDSDSGTAMTLGRTSLVTEQGAERLHRHSLELLTA